MVQPISRAADDNEDSAHLATWLKARAADTRPTRRMRLAWMGRTSDDEVQDPTISLPRQLRSCRAVLGEDMEIGAVLLGRRDLPQGPRRPRHQHSVAKFRHRHSA